MNKVKTDTKNYEDVAPVELLEEGEDLEQLYDTFDVEDDLDLEDIVNGNIGEDYE